MSRPALRDPYEARLLEESRRILRASSRFTGFLFNFLIPADRRIQSLLWYAYLRQIDDAIDDHIHQVPEKLAYLSRHQTLVEEVYRHHSARFVGRLPDDFIVALASRDEHQDLRQPILDMLAAMEEDCQKTSGYPTWSAFERNAKLEVAAYLRALLVFCSQETPPPNGRIGTAAGLGAKIVHLLRDLHRDLHQGRIPVPANERETCGLDDRLRPDASLRAWSQVKRKLAGEHFKEGKRELSGTALPFRYKLCFSLLCAKYETYLRCPNASLDENGRSPGTLARSTIFLTRFLSTLLVVARSGSSEVHEEAVVKAGEKSYIRAIPVAELLPLLLDEVRVIAKSGLGFPGLRRIKALPRYLGASFIGTLSAAIPIPPTGRSHDRRTRRLAARMFGSWALSILAMDALVDDLSPSPEALASFFEQWEKLLDGKTYAENMFSRDEPQERGLASLSLSSLLETLGLARQLRTTLETRYGRDFDLARQKFIGLAMTLARAEKESLKQKNPDTAYNLKWYLERILPNKTEPFLFAPMWACAVSPERLEEFERLFRRMSAGYGHWQIQDDVADFFKDLQNGITTAPGYVLLGQGDLARQILERQSSGALDPGWIVTTANDMGLMDSRFAGLKFSGPWSSRSLDRDQAIRLAVGNGEAALDQSPQNILSAAVTAQDLFLRVRKHRDPVGGLGVLRSSRVLERLVPPAMPPRQAWYDGSGDPAMVRLVDFLETLVRRPTTKAIALKEHLMVG